MNDKKIIGDTSENKVSPNQEKLAQGDIYIQDAHKAFGELRL